MSMGLNEFHLYKSQTIFLNQDVPQLLSTEGFPRFFMISPDFLMHYPLQPRDSRQASKDAVAAVKEADGKSKAAAKALKAPWAAPVV